ncbi:serine hydroxymethyltransferase [Histoplasma capsulatum]|uniref:Serine hydroxymethyltransferase n=1 Tax=Ajellomyces capsulatus TaxID=5037 RepID=A0A8A1MH14_AJECA|nr:serine hydroxymethyltransferase [Histoplasma capsulatum]
MPWEVSCRINIQKATLEHGIMVVTSSLTRRRDFVSSGLSRRSVSRKRNGGSTCNHSLVLRRTSTHIPHSLIPMTVSWAWIFPTAAIFPTDIKPQRRKFPLCLNISRHSHIG